MGPPSVIIWAIPEGEMGLLPFVDFARKMSFSVLTAEGQKPFDKSRVTLYCF